MSCCRHFNGVQHRCCKAGIAYANLLADQRAVNLPCLGVASLDMATCDLFIPLSPAEVAAELDAITDAATILVERLVAGRCVQCGEQPTHMRQVSRAYYAEPCGHRQGVGSATAWNARHKGTQC